MRILCRAVAEYIVLVMLIAFFLPVVWPTDTSPGSPPEPWYVPVAGILAIYVLPLIIVSASVLRQLRR